MCSITLIFLFLYDLISECWQEPNSKASDESARLQFWELEVRITRRGGGRQEQKENNQKRRQGMRDIIVNKTEFGNSFFFSFSLPPSLSRSYAAAM